MDTHKDRVELPAPLINKFLLKNSRREKEIKAKSEKIAKSAKSAKRVKREE